MINSPSDLGLFALAIVIGFGAMIYFMLGYSTRLIERDLQLGADTIWQQVSLEASSLNFTQSNMLFGIFQDPQSTVVSMVVKDSKSQIIAEVFSPMLQRKNIQDRRSKF